MTMHLDGVPQLKARIDALKPNDQLVRRLAISVVAEAKRLVPRRTGNLGRSIVVGHVSPRSAQVKATAAYAAYVEFGTRRHEIRLRSKKALRFAPGVGARLSGTPRKGAQNIIFAKKVNHPGSKPHPFMVPAIKLAARSAGLMAQIVKAWNDAA